MVLILTNDKKIKEEMMTILEIWLNMVLIHIKDKQKEMMIISEIWLNMVLILIKNKEYKKKILEILLILELINTTINKDPEIIIYLHFQQENNILNINMIIKNQLVNKHHNIQVNI